MIDVIWTTVETEEQASSLARLIIEKKLGVCVQISSPIESYYRWEGEIKSEKEFRIAIKCLPSQTSQLERFVKKNHPYECPQWIVISAVASKEYSNWAESAN